MPRRRAGAKRGRESRLSPARQKELVHLGLRHFWRRIDAPRGDRLFARLVQRFHRLPDRIDAVGEEIADQQVGDGVLQMRIVLDELAEAEAVVVFTLQALYAAQ